ncbi:hypothetical protein V2E29_04330 [Streptomyces diastatochromogenes]|uniref:hypothetical protein n=1 Tax=Streptomyces diastatochromogenes TaxID=42236 RepID=UPI002F2640AB
MRQRSLHEAPVDVPAIPATVLPGEVVNWPDLIAGFEPVTDEPPDSKPEASAKSTRSKKSAPAEAPTGEEPKL